VTGRANANTGLVTPDVHYWGNQIGETGNDSGTAVNGSDRLAILANPTGFTPATVTNAWDINRDGAVNGTDRLIVLSNPTGFTSLLLFNPPAPPPPPEALEAGVQSNDIGAEREGQTVVALSQSTTVTPEPVALETTMFTAAAARDVPPAADEQLADRAAPVEPVSSSIDSAAEPGPAVRFHKGATSQPADPDVVVDDRTDLSQSEAKTSSANQTNNSKRKAIRSSSETDSALDVYFTQDEQSQHAVKLDRKLRRRNRGRLRGRGH